MIKDSLYILMSNIYSKFMAYLFYYLTAIFLGTSSFGILRALLPILDTLTIFFTSGIPPSIAKFLAEDKEKDLGNYLGILFLMLFLSIFGFIVMINIKYLLGGGYLEIDNSIYLILGISIFISSIIAFCRGILQGLLRIKELSLTWLTESTLKILFLLFLISLGLLGSFLSLTLASLVTGILFFFYILRIMKFERKIRINFSIVKYAIPISLTSASYRLFGDLDNIIIMSFLGSYFSGIYGYSSLISRGVYMISSSISIPLLPKIAKSKDKNLLKKALILNTLFSSFILLPIFLFPGFFLEFFFHVKTLEGEICLKILLLSSLFMSYFNIISSYLQGVNRAKLSFYIIVLGILINTILNIILIKLYGIVGGSLATLLASLSILIIALMVVRR
ncbi:oligosaccharide flippase family protein [Methanocaldococcus infernus]